MEPNISVSSVSERDVDLLLLEEFVASREFGSWFVGKASPETPQVEACVTAQRSVTQSIGESDLELTFIQSNGKRLLAMVENKVAAGFQAMQADRYRMRGAGYIERGHCDRFITILTAPQAYFGRNDSFKGFDGKVSYEDILNWFLSKTDLGARQLYKIAVLQAAISKGTMGYQPVEDAGATRFWRDYWELVRQHAPELRMSEPGAKPAGATFVAFKPAALSKEASIVHKLTGTKGATTGFVDLQLPGMGEEVLALGVALESLLEEGMSVVRASKSAAIRIFVPVVDPNRGADSQRQAMIEGVSAAKRLLVWFKADERVRAAMDIVCNS